MVNKEVYHCIRACTHCQFVNSCSREAHHLLHTFESDTPFGILFLDFWEPGYIPYQDVLSKILECLDCMTGFGIGASNGLTEITPEQVSL